jgi:hypothetical protein
MFKGINEFKKGNQTYASVIMKHDGIIVTGITSILSRWEKFFSNFLNVNQNTNHEGSEEYTAEPDIPEHNLIEIELAIEKLKKHKFTGLDHIPSELIQAVGGELYEEIHKLFVLICNKEKFPQEWK